MSVREILSRRAALERELATLDDALAVALGDAQKPEEPDRILSLTEAAAYVHEPASTFRQRLCWRQARVNVLGERRLRYSRLALDRVIRERLERVRP